MEYQKFEYYGEYHKDLKCYTRYFPTLGEVCRAVKHLKNREPFLVRHEKNGRGERI